MVEGYRKYLLEGLMYHLNSILFARPARRFITRFIKKSLNEETLRVQLSKLVCSNDMGVLIVDASRYYDYAYRYKGEGKVVKQFKCLLQGIGTRCFY